MHDHRTNLFSSGGTSLSPSNGLSGNDLAKTQTRSVAVSSGEEKQGIRLSRAERACTCQRSKEP